MGRPRKCRCICSKPRVTRFLPENGGRGCAVIGYDEYEVMRLLDFEYYSQEQCARKMQVSRPTVTRMYEHARHQIADALVNGRELVIRGGDVLVCAHPKPECAGVIHCCHREEGENGEE